MKPQVDLLVYNCGELVTMAGPQGPRTGHYQGRAGIVRDGAVAARDGVIVAAGPQAEVEASVQLGPHAFAYDAQGQLVTPGLVDPHTHAVYAGSRQHELELKLQGRSYLEILEAGGGIHHTVRATRAAGRNRLQVATAARLRVMLEHGTTAVEIKSGYGLDLHHELEQLEVVAALQEHVPQKLVATFLGAHAVPLEYGDQPGAYVDLVVGDMLPRVVGLARYCDVFCERGAFTPQHTRRILSRARELGMGLKLHADELSDLGGAELAAELGAVSADHLLCVSPPGIRALARAGVIAVLLPGTSFYLGKPYAPARDLVEAGVPVALATDANPGSSPTENLQLVLNLACLYLRLTPAEALCAATINAAHACGLGQELGSLEPGKRADLVVFRAPDHHYLGYHYGVNLVQAVFAGGRLVVESNQKGEQF
ncbi:MAG: imidazolonepropionase [Bacillota bacterium]